MNKLNTKSQYWLDTAQYDIETAKAMLETKRYLYVGFLCHLSILIIAFLVRTAGGYITVFRAMSI